VAIRTTLQPGTASFTEENLSALSAKIVAAAEKRGAVLR
jgi:phenylalanyl-tRNA synthetase beta subunit